VLWVFYRLKNDFRSALVTKSKMLERAISNEQISHTVVGHEVRIADGRDLNLEHNSIHLADAEIGRTSFVVPRGEEGSTQKTQEQPVA
jgi:hypothetical protein